MSGNLACNATNCIHNNSGMCSASSIHVQGGNAHSSEYTQCGTFIEMGIKNSLSNVYNMNIGGEVKQSFNNFAGGIGPRIICDAINCRYNINKDCVANFVHINGVGAISSNRTDCDTFKM
ncbi:DUF1540 domain-containing protein [uncultured Clostridium sp.]|uniref:DUF1540 domain-containing protein n=1 Tax=uncultured Clostridium sp. TaxID=59620 RepID=UPI0032175F4F